MSGIEYGDARRGRASSFPAEWGLPPGDAYSEERAAWVREKVRAQLRGAPSQQLRRQQVALMVYLRRLQDLYEEEANA